MFYLTAVISWKTFGSEASKPPAGARISKGPVGPLKFQQYQQYKYRNANNISCLILNFFVVNYSVAWSCLNTHDHYFNTILGLVNPTRPREGAFLVYLTQPKFNCMCEKREVDIIVDKQWMQTLHCRHTTSSNSNLDYICKQDLVFSVELHLGLIYFLLSLIPTPCFLAPSTVPFKKIR